MKAYQDNCGKFDRLRQQAEELIQNRVHPDAAPPDILDLIHELSIYHAELEIQNEELKKAQEALSDLHREYERLYEFAPCGYVTLNAKGIITHVNLTGVSLLAAPKRFLLHSGLSPYIAEDWQDAFLAARRKAGDTGKKQSVRLPLKRGKSLPLWVRADIQADRNESGAVLQWCVVLVDITREKQAEAALSQSEERFRRLFENAPIAYQSLDADGKLVQVNTAWEEITGFARSEVLGRNFAEFIPEQVRAGFKKQFAREKSIDKILGSEFTILNKSGEQILVAHRGKPGVDVGGNFTQTHCVLIDITALRKAEDEKRQLEDQLRQTQKMETIGTLAGGVAHDINNILTIIIGNNELAMSEVGAWRPLKDNLEEIRLASLRAKDVVHQLLTFARQNDQEQKPLNISAVVRDSLKLIRSTIPANIEIQQRLPADIAPVLGNNTQINQLIINLCSNAADAMLPIGGRLTIEMDNITLDEAMAHSYHCLKPGAYVKIVVADTGCGMDAKTLERIFEPYYTTKKIGKGTGIGLAVVLGIVEQHNGVIAVESKPDHRTAFTVLLPAFHGQVEDEAPQDNDLPKGHESILFVDDEASIVKLTQIRLENLGYRITGATDPRAALDMFRADPMAFDLVVTDMAMPHMTGETLSGKLISLRPDLPIILCTGYSETVTEECAHKIGISSFLMKPVNITDFAVAVRKTLDKAKNLKGLRYT